MRLAKFLATRGVASRRAAEQIVRAGRVSIDGEAVTDPARDVGPASHVRVDGRSLATEPELVVYALNKPLGVVSTARDPQRRPTVTGLVPARERLYPVGRLDIDTSGLILLTNDGELAHRMTHPSFEVPRTYRARVANPPIAPRALAALRAGVELEDGRTAPAKVRRLAPDALELTLHEGRKRQVRRMLAALGHPVRALERVRFGPLALGDLRPGEHRRLTAAEVRALRAAGRSDRRGAGGSSSGRRPRPPR